MSNTREILVDRFFVVPKEGMVQAGWDIAVANADITERLKCTITRNLNVERKEVRDCRDEDLVNTIIRTRFRRWTLNFTEVSPQIVAMFTAWFLGTAAAPTGTPANEVQTLTRGGTVSGGTFTLAMTLEGRTVTTKPIAWNASTTDIQNALTASRMLFIQPGDVTLTGNWGTAMTVTFGGRLAHANLPMMVADVTNLTGSGHAINVAEGTPGDQNFHAFSRSTTRDKQLISICLGWEDDTDRVEKYINVAVESLNPTLSLDGDVGFQVGLISPWDYDSIETAFSIPDCNNVTPLPVSDCRLELNSVWQTTDINSLNVTVNDNVPVDRISAFAFDGIEIQSLKRGNQPTYSYTLGLFGSEVDSVYGLAHDERTQAAVPTIIHFGMPGNRCTWAFPETKLRFQSDPLTQAGSENTAVVQLEGIAFKDGTDAPMSAEAYVDQSVDFLAD